MKKIDIFDLNYDLSCEKARQVENIEKLKNKSIIYGVYKFIGGFVLSTILLRFNIFCLKSKAVAVVSSDNQLKALRGVILNHDSLKVVSLTVAYHNKKFGMQRFPDALAYMISLFFIIPVIIKRNLSKSKLLRKSMYTCLDRYALSYGMYLLAHICIKLGRPEIVYFSNDHCVWHRALLKACQENGVKTAYLQHAMVAESFPRLEFDYCFLDGAMSNSQYRRNEQCEVYLVGAARMNHEKVITRETSCYQKCIGLGFNTLDSDERIRDILSQACYLKEKFGFSVKVRMHPKDNREYLTSYFRSLGFIESSVDKESASDFVDSIDLLVAGETGLHMEAFMGGVGCYTLLGWTCDFYGFINKGIVKEVKSLEELSFSCDRSPNSDSIRRIINAAYGLRDGFSISELICEITSGSDNFHKYMYFNHDNEAYEYKPYLYTR